MTSRIETCKNETGRENQLAATRVDLLQRSRFDQNYGAMTMVMSYLPRFEQLKMQGLDRWQYNTGVGRVLVRFVWPKMFYFVDYQRPPVFEISETGEFKVFDYGGESEFSNKDWFCCQVGRSRLFQAHDSEGIFRILKVDPSQRSFTVEKLGFEPQIRDVSGLTNFKDQFIFLFCRDAPRRYSLAEDRWEELPPHKDSIPRSARSLADKVYVITADNRNSEPISACSLGHKVYVFAWDCTNYKNVIHVLHNPGASISSQELHWQVIVVPQNIVWLRFGAGFVPLNSTEIAILGGMNDYPRWLGEVITFNTSTCEFKKEMNDETNPFCCFGNSSIKVCENTIIVLVTDKLEKTRLIKYKKGDTRVTNIQMPASAVPHSDDSYDKE